MSRLPTLLLVLAITRFAIAGERSAGEVAAELREVAARGHLTDPVLKLYREYVTSRIHQQSGELADWLRERPILLDGLVSGLPLDGDRKVLANLALLRKASSDGVERFPHLALAFVFAWGAGEGDEPRRFWEEGWKAKGRTIPGMVESFDWFVTHAADLRTDLRNSPWTILVWLADCDVPLDEREWVLERYRDRSVHSLRNLFAEVPYRNGMAGRSPRLENYLEYGGICVHNVQYHLGVMRALGIPGMWSGGPGHVWPWWIDAHEGKLRFRRANFLGNRTGTTRNLLSRSRFHEDDVRLLVAAMNHSYDGWREARIGCHVYDLVQESGPPTAGLLLGALERNPYCAPAWEGVVAAAGALSTNRKRRLSRLTLDHLTDHPAVFLDVVGAAGPDPRLLARTEEFLAEYANRDTGLFKRALGQALGLLPGGTDGGHRRRYLETLLQGMEAKKGRARRHVAAMLIQEYEAAGQTEHASELRLRLLKESRTEVSPFGDEAGLFRSAICGGGGGGEFEERFAKEPVLIGFRYGTTKWSGHRIVRALQPIFSSSSGETHGMWHGRPGRTSSEVKARPGYAVGGIIVKSGRRVDGMAVVFFRRRAGKLDSRDYYISDWFGGTGGGAETLLGANGDPVVGLRGRSGADLDAIGLILRSSP